MWECKNVMCEMFVFMKSSAYVNSLAGLCTCLCVLVRVHACVFGAEWPSSGQLSTPEQSRAAADQLSPSQLAACRLFYSLHLSLFILPVSPSSLSTSPNLFYHFHPFFLVIICASTQSHNVLPWLIRFITASPPFFGPHHLITTKALWTKLLSSCFPEWVNITAALPLDFFSPLFLSFLCFFPPFPLR